MQDRNQELRDLGTPASQLWRSDYFLKLRPEVINHKRMESLYAKARLKVKRRKRKKPPIAD